MTSHVGGGTHGGNNEAPQGGKRKGGSSGGGETTGGSKPPTNEGEHGGGPKGNNTDVGNAPTQPGPPRRPEQGHPLDSTHPGNKPADQHNQKVVEKHQQTVDTNSPQHTQDTESPNPPAKGRQPGKGEVLVGTKIEPQPRIPDSESITIKTPKGPEKMTVGEYRRRWNAAQKWLGDETRKLNLPKGKIGPPELHQTGAGEVRIE